MSALRRQNQANPKPKRAKQKRQKQRLMPNAPLRARVHKSHNDYAEPRLGDQYLQPCLLQNLHEGISVWPGCPRSQQAQRQ